MRNQHDATYYRNRAEEFQTVSNSMVDLVAREMMRSIADGYQRFAIACEINQAQFGIDHDDNVTSMSKLK